MKKQQNPLLMPTNFKTVILDLKKINSRPLKKTVHCNFNTNFYLLDYSNITQEICLNFSIAQNCTLNFYVLVAASNNSHKFLFNFSHQSNSSLNMSAKLFATSNALIDVNAQIQVKKNTHDVISSQSIDGFLLSNNAQINTLPILIVDTNRVKVNHAVKISRMDFAKLFYLQTKGFDQKQATQILLDHELAFLQPISSDKSKNYVRLMQE